MHDARRACEGRAFQRLGVMVTEEALPLVQSKLASVNWRRRGGDLPLMILLVLQKLGGRQAVKQPGIQTGPRCGPSS